MVFHIHMPLLRGPLRGWAEDLLDPGPIQRQVCLRQKTIQTLWRLYLIRRFDHNGKFRNVLIYSLVYDNLNCTQRNMSSKNSASTELRSLLPQSPSYAVKTFDSCLALLKKLRKLIVNNPGWSQDETHFIRKAEFEYCISSNVFHDKNVLEIGGSDGYLASLIYALSPSSLVSIDCVPALPSFHNVESSNAFIDGHVLSFEDNTFDVIFSSNTFEHIKDSELLLRECARVLRPQGVIVTMLPSHLWRIASIFNQIFNLLPPLPHGEHSLTAFDEIVRFHPWWWKYKFGCYGFKCNGVFSCGYFYAEPRIFALDNSTIWLRGVLAKLCGPSAHVYFLSKKL